MAVQLEATIKRFIGLSTDDKPITGRFLGGNRIETIPVGSSFMETDTSRIWRYDGEEWTYGQALDETGHLLSAILCELQELNRRLDLVTA